MTQGQPWRYKNKARLLNPEGWPASTERKRLSKPVLLAMPVLAVAIIVLVALLPFAHTSAVQSPRISLDMVTTGNTYDETTNTMVVGAIDSCSSDAVGNNATHVHQVDVVVQTVEDLIGWQVRLNYDGGEMRPQSANFTLFTDNNTGDSVSFVNLPIDQSTSTHRTVIGATDIPAAAPGPQTALIGSTYQNTRTAPLSPDTPAKSVPDDTSYTAATGGILARLNLQVLAGNAGQLLTMDLDDDSPNTPGSSVIIFTGSGESAMNLTEGDLSDGSHGEGLACAALTPQPTSTTAPGESTSAGATTPPAAGATTPGGGTGKPTATLTGGATPQSSQAADGGGWPTWGYFLLAGGLAMAAVSVGAALWLRSRPRRGG